MRTSRPALALTLGLASLAGASPRVEELLRSMTLEEKVGQLNLLTSDRDVTGPSVRPGYLEDIEAGRVGAVFNAYTAAFTRELQERAVRGSRLGIPLLFGYDVIHGHRTIFPIPLAEAASWDLAAVERAARISALEATAEGLHWTFAPMVDVARDPRWGRIAEGSGEDPLLGARMAAARVRGFQGEDLAARDTLAACAKHFVAYGAAQAGRDYHSVDLSPETLEDVHLPPFRAALDAGVATVMAAFNDVNGIPATAHRGLLRGVLRERWGFDGMLVSDYTAVNELVPHGYAADGREAARLAFLAGIDMDMQGGLFAAHLVDLVRAGAVPPDLVDDAARRVLELKERLGLLEDPFRYGNSLREKLYRLHPRHRAHARELATRSAVLLRNEGDLLPLDGPGRRVALVGPLAGSTRDLIGSWSAAGSGDDATSVAAAFAAREGWEVRHVPGCTLEGTDRRELSDAVAAALESDVVVAVVGEGYHQSGEAASRTDLRLPGVQRDLLRELEATGKPVVLVVMSGRPLDLSWEAETFPVLLQAWFLGTEAGPAIVDLLLGDASPSGRLPVTFPRSVGQVPLFHAARATGRPWDPSRPDDKYKSRYLDSPNSPLFPFGYGLTYSSVQYSGLEVAPREVDLDGEVRVAVTLTNEGRRGVAEVVQLYVRDRVGERTRPVRQLADFRRVELAPGERRRIEFRLRPRDLAYSRGGPREPPEPGDFDVWVAPDASSGPRGSFLLR